MTRSPRNHRITIIYQILHLMHCKTYVNLYHAVRSVIPCDKLHKHQFLCFAQVDSDCATFSNFVNKGDIDPIPHIFFFFLLILIFRISHGDMHICPKNSATEQDQC